MQLSEEIIKILEYIGKQVGVTIDWTNANIIPYVQELIQRFIRWEISTSVIWIILATVFLSLCLIGTVLIHKYCYWDGLEWVIFAIICITSVVVISVQIFDIVTCNVFPEKVLYDKISYYIEMAKR